MARTALRSWAARIGTQIIARTTDIRMNFCTRYTWDTVIDR